MMKFIKKRQKEPSKMLLELGPILILDLMEMNFRMKKSVKIIYPKKMEKL